MDIITLLTGYGYYELVLDGNTFGRVAGWEPVGRDMVRRVF